MPPSRRASGLLRGKVLEARCAGSMRPARETAPAAETPRLRFAEAAMHAPDPAARCSRCGCWRTALGISDPAGTAPPADRSLSLERGRNPAGYRSMIATSPARAAAPAPPGKPDPRERARARVAALAADAAAGERPPRAFGPVSASTRLSDSTGARA